MPSKFPWKSNRSQHESVGNSSTQPSPAPSVNNNNEAHQQQQQQYSPPPEGPPPQHFQQPQTSPGHQQQHIAPEHFRQPNFSAARPGAHRHSSNLSLDQHINRPGSQHQQDIPHSPHLETPNDRPRRASHQPLSGVGYTQSESKKSLRSIVAKLSGQKSSYNNKGEDPSQSSQKSSGLGRRASTRKTEPERLQLQTSERLQAQQWQQRQGSSPNLPSSTEEDESELLDPYLVREEQHTPRVPPKDAEYQHQHQHPQQFAPGQHYRPPLASVNTDGNYHGQGGVDHYGPEQHPGLQQQQQPPPQQYQSYSPAVDQPQQQSPQYQAFNPQTGSSTLGPNAQQLHHQEVAQQQNYYTYQQQQQQQAQSQVQQQHQHSPQGQQPEHIQYQQQQFSQTHPQQGSQEFQPSPSSPQRQQQLELQHPQPSQKIPQIVRHNSQIDTQHIQHLHPASSQQQTPSSPLQYQAYDPQSGQQQELQQAHPQAGEIRTQDHIQQSQQQPQSQQSQPGMPPPANQSQQRNSLRKVNDVGHPGPPSREPSVLQQPQGQNQHVQQPGTPGLPTFGANVVPTASQGQPYRGENKAPQGQGGEMGRATPPPRTVADMSEEEILTLIKDHDTLRDKYQKVKRYFFEQQSQVHQLQNTLAHQRLSLSKTVWDDSEYTARFTRLDGLVAQLSYAVRKDWKSIPPWLQPVVNKNAVETGKQEMTAVGRAFISHWLVENIFDKHFHPDLEPGLSTQLKMIQLNIRKLAPPCQSLEDEDALVAKIINWRLATLEGLSEMLKSPQAVTNRENLTRALNENLIGSLQMYLTDPAPPDINGGVPMIVELAVSIAHHVPQESRDVQIEYFPPGHSLVPEFMKMESGILPALTNPIADAEDDGESLLSVASVTAAAEQDQLQESAQAAAQQQQNNAPPVKETPDKSRGMFGFGKSKKAATQPAQLSKRESSLGQSLGHAGGGSQQSLAHQRPSSSGGNAKEEQAPRVRMAIGVAAQIRGKTVVFPAPVYST